MTALQIILIVIGSLITLFFVVAFFLPSSKYISREIIINQPASDVYRLVTDFSNYKKWNPWSAQEPDAQGTISGEPGKPGHKWSWQGKKIGSGYMKIKELRENQFALSDLVFTAPRKMNAEDIWKFEEIDSNTARITWAHRAFLGYPVARFFGLMLEKMLAPEFEKGLENLKKLSESYKRNE